MCCEIKKKLAGIVMDLFNLIRSNGKENNLGIFFREF